MRLALSVPPTPAHVEAANVYAQLCTPPVVSTLLNKPRTFWTGAHRSCRALPDRDLPLAEGRYLRLGATFARADLCPEDAIVVAYGSLGSMHAFPASRWRRLSPMIWKLATIAAHQAEIVHASMT